MATNLLVTVTPKNTSIPAFAISSADVISFFGIDSDANSHLTYERDGVRHDIEVGETPASLVSALKNILTLTLNSDGSTFYLNGDRIHDVETARTSEANIFYNNGGVVLKKIEVDESVASIKTAQAANVPEPSGDFVMLTTDQTVAGEKTFTSGITSGAPNVYNSATTITAFAGGGQADATDLTAEFNEITVCATAGDSVKLPAAAAGLSITVKNNGADDAAVFPATGDSINALAANASITLPVGASVTFKAVDATVWEADNETVVAGNGTVALPSVQVGQDGDGFYRVGSNQLGVSVADGLVGVFDDEGSMWDSVRLRVGLGTPGTGVTAKHYGDGRDITTVLTLTNVNLGTPTAGANLALGALIYTFPAGAHVHNYTYMDIKLLTGGVTTDTPDVGIGSELANGVVAVLGGTATFEDYITGQTATDCNNTPTYKTSVATAGALTGISINEAAGTKTVHVNAADGWDAAVTGDLIANGTVVLKWTYLAS